MTRLLLTSDLGHIQVPGGWDSHVRSVLASAGFEPEFWDPRCETVRDARGMLVNAPRIGGAELDRVPRLEALVRFGSGIDNIDIAECERRGVLVRNIPGPIAIEMAGAITALVTERLFDLRQKETDFLAHGWRTRSEVRATGLMGSVVGLVGTGRIAGRVSRALRSLGAQVCYSSSSAPPGESRGVDGDRLELDALCRAADVIVVLSPLRPETKSMFGADQIAQMRPGAHLIAISRGGVVDQWAAVDAVRNRRIESLHLDVFDDEPVDAADLMDIPGLSVTPHNAAWSAGFYTETLREAVRIFDEVLG